MNTQELLSIQDHRITLFYFFNTPCDIEKQDYDHLLKILPTEQSTAFSKKNTATTQALWKVHSYNISVDMMKNITHLFHAKENKTITTWKLVQPAIELLNGETCHTPLTLAFNKGSQKRLQESTKKEITSSPLIIENILLHQFKTGFCIATVECSIHQENLTSCLLNETLYSLSRFNTIHWEKTEKTSKPATTQMGKLIRQLINNEKSSKVNRVYSHTSIQLDTTPSPSRLNSYLTKLSRHYHDAYQIPESTRDTLIISDYDNIHHYITQEGAATAVLVDPNSPEILTDYKNKVISPVHIPIHLLAYHLEQAMQHYASHSNIWIENTPSSLKQTEQLHDYQRQLLNLNLNFFYPVISTINTHNQIHQGLIQAKKLDQQHQKLTSNIQTNQQIIEENQQHENTRRNIKYCKIASLGIAAAGYLTAFSIIKEGIEALGEIHSIKEKAPEIADWLHHYVGSISLTGSLLIMIIIYILSRKHCPYASGHHHTPSQHALHAIHTRHPLHHKKH